MQVTVGVVLSATGAAIALPAAAYTVLYSDAEGADLLGVVNAAIFVWTAGNALQVASTSLAAKLFWIDVQYAGIAAMPVAVFGFAATYAGRTSWARPRRLVALGAPVVAVAVTVWVAPDLVRTEAALERTGGVVRIARTFGPVFWAGWLYSTALNVVSTVLLVGGALNRAAVFRRQSAAIVVGATVPWAAQFAYLGGVSPFEPESFFVVTGVAFVLAVTRFRLLDLVPTARRTVVERIDDPLVVVDESGHVVDTNAAARRLFDVDDSPVGDPVTDLLAARSAVAAWNEAGRPDRVVTVEGDVDRHFDPRTIDVGGDATALLFHDVTSLERKNERLERIATTLTHDLRNPLTVARGHVDLAREGDTASLDDVDAALDRMEALVEDVLTLARQEAPADTERVSLAVAAREAWDTVDTGVSTLELPDEEVVVRADRGQFRSLLENLFRNAVEHGATGGPVAPDDAGDGPSRRSESDDGVDAAADDAGVTVIVGRPSDGSGFFVADDGRGIPPDDREHVFDHGYTTAEDGTGFGLAIVERVADHHDWSVSVTESAAGGARFEFATGDAP